MLMLMILFLPLAVLAADTVPRSYEPGLLEPLYNLGKSIVVFVYGEPLPVNKLNDFFTDQFDSYSVWQKTQPVLKTEVGLAVIVSLAIAFAILMPILGLIFCLCRVCNRCGGRRKHSRPNACVYCGFFWCVIICVISLIAGVVLYTVNNSKAWDGLPSMRENIKQQLGSLASYADNTKNDIHDAFDREISTLGANNTIGQDFVKDLRAKIEEKLAFDTVAEVGKTMEKLVFGSLKLTAADVGIVSNATQNLYKDASVFISSLEEALTASNQSAALNTTLLSSAVTSEADQYKIALLNDQFYLTEITARLTAAVTEQNITQQVLDSQAQINEKFANISKKIEASMSGVSSAANASGSAMFQSLDGMVKKLVTGLLDAQSAVDRVLSPRSLDSYQWAKYLLLIVIFPILSIIAFAFFGLVCGAADYRHTAPPMKRGLIGHCGGHFLLVAVALCFIFSSLVTLLTLGLFVTGYTMENLICTPLFTQPRDLKMMEFLEANVKRELNLTISLEKALTSCENNQGLVEAFDLPIDAYVDTASSSSPAIDLSQLNESLSAVADQTIALREKLVGMQDSLRTGAESLENYEFTLQIGTAELDSTVLKSEEFLLKSAESLEQKDALQKNLAKLKESLGIFKNETITAAQQHLKQTQADWKNLQVANDMAVDSLGNSDNVEAWSTKVRKDLEQSLSGLTSGFVERIMADIKKNTGKCRVLHDIYVNAGDVLCKQVLNPVHGIWLSLAWCLLFFIPLIVFATKLSRYYLRMAYPGSYSGDDDSSANTELEYMSAFDATPTLKIPRVHPRQVPSPAVGFT